MALLHGSSAGKNGRERGCWSGQARTATDSGIPSSVRRLRMFTPSSASLRDISLFFVR